MNKDTSIPMPSIVMDSQTLDDDCVSMISSSSVHSLGRLFIVDDDDDDDGAGDFAIDDDDDDEEHEDCNKREKGQNRWTPPAGRNFTEDAPKRPDRRASDSTFLSQATNDGSILEEIDETTGDTASDSTTSSSPSSSLTTKIPERRSSSFGESTPCACLSTTNSSMFLEREQVPLRKISSHPAAPRIPRRRHQPLAQELSSILAATVNARISTLKCAKLPHRHSSGRSKQEGQKEFDTSTSNNNFD